MNIIILLFILIVCTCSIFLFYKTMDRTGLYSWIILGTILSYISTFQTIEIFNYKIISSVPIYISVFTALYILVEKHGLKDALQGCKISLITSIVTGILIFIMISYSPSINDKISMDLNNLFMKDYILFIIFPIITYASERLCTYSYHILKKEYKSIFISNIMTCILIQLIDTIILLIFGKLLTNSIDEIIILILSSYILKIFCSLIYTIELNHIINKKVIE